MLDKNERNKLLTELSTSNYGRALFDYLEEELDNMGDIEKMTQETFLSSQMAVRKVREIMRFLKRVGLDNTEKSNIKYT